MEKNASLENKTIIGSSIINLNNNITEIKKDNKYQENMFLKNKTKREEERGEKENSKKNILKKQLEFYFTDENLLNDKFLQKFFNKDIDLGVPIEIILNFNRIKEILGDIKETNKKIDLIKNCVESSDFLKLNKKRNKISRSDNFNLDKIDTEDIDERTIYVENLPVSISHSLLTSIFSRSGKVVHVSIPKFSDNKKAKGFGFIIFKTNEEAKKAILEMNNKVPKEFLNWGNDLPLRELVIYSKKHWLDKKEEFKILKLELQNENKDLFANCFKQTNEDIMTIRPGTFIILKDLPEKITKNEIKIWISHFVEPTYIDLNLSKRECIIRFSHPIFAESFVNKFESSNEKKISEKNILIEKLGGEEEEKYIKKVELLKKEFSHKKLNKKKNINEN